jgi:hypothetical protein
MSIFHPPIEHIQQARDVLVKEATCLEGTALHVAAQCRTTTCPCTKRTDGVVEEIGRDTFQQRTLSGSAVP